MKTVINSLKSLNLNIDNSIYINQLLDQIPGSFQQVIEIPKGHKILRCRPNLRYERFYTRNSLQYAPINKCNSYQRASIPGESMFYGSIYIFNQNQDIGNELRISTVLECLPWLKSDETKGYQKITFSQWETLEDLRFIVVCNYNNYDKPHSLIAEMKTSFNLQLNSLTDNSEEFREYSSFISDEFSKNNVDNSLQYQVSAIFSSRICKHGFDGILYPGVKLEGKYLNVAITPINVDKKLKLLIASESFIYKNEKNLFLSNETIGIVNDQRLTFDYSKVERNFRTSENEWLQKIKMSDKSELNNYGFF